MFQKKKYNRKFSFGNNETEFVISLPEQPKCNWRKQSWLSLLKKIVSLSQFFPSFLSIVDAFLEDCRQFGGPCCLLLQPLEGLFTRRVAETTTSNEKTSIFAVINIDGFTALLDLLRHWLCESEWHHLRIFRELSLLQKSHLLLLPLAPSLWKRWLLLGHDRARRSWGSARRRYS